MKKEWKFPFWENYQKDRITAKLFIIHEDGKETSSTATVSKYQADGSINKDFQQIIDQNTIEKINENTKEREERHKNRRKSDKKAQEERIQAQKLENLFNAKLEVFEIEPVKNSKNRKLKAKIRKSKSIFEMQAYLSLLIQEEYNNESIPTPESV